MGSPIRQPSQRLVTAAWLHAASASVTAVAIEPDAEQVLWHCQRIIAALPDEQQRQVINALAAGRYEQRILDRVKRGTATTSDEAATDGAATTPGLSGGSCRTATPANVPWRRLATERVARAWNLP